MWFGEICSSMLSKDMNTFHETTYKLYFWAKYLCLSLQSRILSKFPVSLINHTVCIYTTVNRGVVTVLGLDLKYRLPIQARKQNL